MNMVNMQPPTTRAEFEHRFHLLREIMRQGRYYFPQGAASGLERIRFLPNGRIDFLSVNESARLQANMMSQFGDDMINSMAENQENNSSESGEG